MCAECLEYLKAGFQLESTQGIWMPNKAFLRQPLHVTLRRSLGLGCVHTFKIGFGRCDQSL